MDSNPRDTFFRRFSTFWFGLGLFVAFGILAVVIVPCSVCGKVDAEDKNAERRMKVNQEVNAAEEAALKEANPTTAFDKVGAELLKQKPSASDKPAAQ
ncbi:hypothetical protein [Persicirhabdus sediminis]|uniref:Uncharacterized protein n=1 Tax=Persicirhabdus sediminis TaxID=454144 RepID=A0A8J7MEK2_9BACT|nr:hypothetical protein [Persicirhabdus sediminis]MBK1790399.1 hypothetical protein [Persicirhabdus sediminis]